MAYALHASDRGLRDEPGFLGRLRAAFAANRRYRETLAELDRMTDRELLDLNLSRHVLRDLAREAVYGR